MADNEFEILDLTALRRRNEGWVHQIFGEVSRKTAAQQVVIGGASGWFAGYLFVKVGKLAALSIGSTVLLLQIAQHQGFIHINWTRVNRGIDRAARRLEEETSRNLPYLQRNIRRFLKENVFLTASFAGGFLIGMAF